MEVRVAEVVLLVVLGVRRTATSQQHSRLAAVVAACLVAGLAVAVAAEALFSRSSSAGDGPRVEPVKYSERTSALS